MHARLITDDFSPWSLTRSEQGWTDIRESWIWKGLEHPFRWRASGKFLCSRREICRIWQLFSSENSRTSSEDRVESYSHLASHPKKHLANTILHQRGLFLKNSLPDILFRSQIDQWPDSQGKEKSLCSKKRRVRPLPWHIQGSPNPFVPRFWANTS